MKHALPLVAFVQLVICQLAAAQQPWFVDSRIASIPFNPTGNFAFLSENVTSGERRQSLQQFQENIPFEWIEVEWSEMRYRDHGGSDFRAEALPSRYHQVRINADLRMTYDQWLEGDELVNRRVGSIGADRIGRLWFLLDRVSASCSEKQEKHFSLPTCDLRIKLSAAPVVEHSKTLLGGSYVGWLIESVMMRAITEISWSEATKIGRTKRS